MVRILLADPHENALWAQKTLLQEEPGFEVVGEAVDGASLLSLAERLHPDLILLDSDLPGDLIQHQIAALHRLKHKPVVLTLSSNPEKGRLLLRSGADAFVSKGEQPEWLLQILRHYKKRAARKEAPINPEKL